MPPILLNMFGSLPKHPSSSKAIMISVPTNIISKTPDANPDPSVPTQAVCLLSIMANQLPKTVQIGRKQDQDSSGKSCPKKQLKMVLETRNLVAKHLTLTRTAARAPRPFPFALSQLSLPFVLILLILTPAPPSDDGSLIIADVSTLFYISPLDLLRFIFSPRRGRGTGDIQTNFAPMINSVPELGTECDRNAGEELWCCQFASEVKLSPAHNTHERKSSSKKKMFFFFFLLIFSFLF